MKINISSKVEDYLEAILNITEEKGYARTKDIAMKLEIKAPSVVEMIKRLDKGGLIIYRKYESVTLTPEGKGLAISIRDRHNIIRNFLNIIEVPANIANKDACTMEHNLNPKTIEQIEKLVNFVKNAPDNSRWLEHFKEFCKTGKHECKMEWENYFEKKIICHWKNAKEIEFIQKQENQKYAKIKINLSLEKNNKYKKV